MCTAEQVRRAADLAAETLPSVTLYIISSHLSTTFDKPRVKVHTAEQVRQAADLAAEVTRHSQVLLLRALRVCAAAPPRRALQWMQAACEHHHEFVEEDTWQNQCFLSTF